MPQDLALEVLHFVSQQASVPLKTLTMQTTLMGDIGIDGDDGDEFFVAFAKRFEMRVDGLDLTRYFNDEGGGPGCLEILCMLWRAILRKKDPRDPPAVRGKIPIRIEDLVNSAQTGRWQLPDV